MTTSDYTLQDRADSFVGWAQRNATRIGAAAVGTAAILAGAYFYTSSQSTKQVAAERAYFQAQQTIASGNVPLATTDLRKAADRYRGTAGGTQAAFALAQLLYDQGKYAEGITAVERVEPANDAERSSKAALIAAGLEGQGKFADAAARYQEAAGASSFAGEKSALRASAARALMAGGKKAEARAIWTEIAKDPADPRSDEAKIRLGELSVGPA